MGSTASPRGSPSTAYVAYTFYRVDPAWRREEHRLERPDEKERFAEVVDTFGERFEQIYIRPPSAPQRLLAIGRIREAAIATSAAALLIDPRRHAGHANACGATVVAPDCTLADALTKPCMLEPNRARELAARFGAEVAFLDVGRLP